MKPSVFAPAGVWLLAAGAALAVPTAWAAKPAAPEVLQGVVTQVIDGDTLRFTVAGQPAIEVRLAQIDAPEVCQAWGAEAKRALSELALNKPATLRPTGRDRQGRRIGVLLVEGASVGQQLVQEGHAWSLVGRNGRGPLVKEERVAKSLGRGLHAGGGAVKPEDFLRSHGPCK
jgi:endonuclease YncB( thermonuclease family)